MAKAKKAAKAAGKKVAGKGEVLVVASKVRQYVRAKDVNMSSEVIGALNCAVHTLLDKAVVRTTENKRKTLRPQDL
jgi:hypothetical protein